MALKVFSSDTRQIGNAFLVLEAAVDLDAKLGIGVGRRDDRGCALHALHRCGARTTRVTQSAAGHDRRMMMSRLGGRATDRMAPDRRLFVRLDPSVIARRFLRPQQFDLHPIDDVVEPVQIGLGQSVLHRAAAFALHANRIAGIAHGQIQQAARHQNRVLHLAHGAHEFFHTVQDAGIAELWFVVPGDPAQTPAKKITA